VIGACLSPLSKRFGTTNEGKAAEQAQILAIGASTGDERERGSPTFTGDEG
jgi:hypothetical protein